MDLFRHREKVRANQSFKEFKKFNSDESNEKTISKIREIKEHEASLAYTASETKINPPTGEIVEAGGSEDAIPSSKETEQISQKPKVPIRSIKDLHEAFQTWYQENKTDYKQSPKKVKFDTAQK